MALTRIVFLSLKTFLIIFSSYSGTFLLAHDFSNQMLNDRSEPGARNRFAPASSRLQGLGAHPGTQSSLHVAVSCCQPGLFPVGLDAYYLQIRGSKEKKEGKTNDPSLSIFCLPGLEHLHSQGRRCGRSGGWGGRTQAGLQRQAALSG